MYYITISFQPVVLSRQLWFIKRLIFLLTYALIVWVDWLHDCICLSGSDRCLWSWADNQCWFLSAEEWWLSTHWFVTF